MRVLYDIDGVLCENGKPENFASAIPIQKNIDAFNNLVDSGNQVYLYTSRRLQDREETEKWLREYGVKFSRIIFNKPRANLYIDNKASPFVPNLGANLKRKKVGICISGGMDSFIAYHYAQQELKIPKNEIININFNIGQPYADKEQIALKALKIPYETINIDLIRKAFGNIPTEEKYIIPARNLIFASIVGGFAEKVWIMGMKYENHYLMFDKNDVFFNYATICLSQALGDYTVVESPFIKKTKTDIIKWAIEHNISNLDKTTSCYHPTEIRCGVCSLCFKRYIAMKACGLEEKYTKDPRESEEAKRLVVAYKEALSKNDFTHYQKDRIEETLKVLGV